MRYYTSLANAINIPALYTHTLNEPGFNLDALQLRVEQTNSSAVPPIIRCIEWYSSHIPATQRTHTV